MKLSLAYLHHFIQGLPADLKALRNLCDDVGLEVKKVENLPHDTIITFELLANRGDHHAYAGVARELYGRIQTSTLPVVEQLALTEQRALPIEIKIATDKVLTYAAAFFELSGKAATMLSESYAYPLTVADMEVINLVVDVTNLVNIELGQPLHAFDADKIVGKVVVRESQENEMAYPLGATEAIQLPAGMIVIADDEKILAIAGVVGCEESKVTSSTHRFLLEAAVFDPVMVRQCSQKLKIRTLASARFEKGGDVDLAVVGLQRACAVLAAHHAFDVAPQLSVAKQFEKAPAEIMFDVTQANHFFDTDIPSQEMKMRLERYGFHLSEIKPNIFRVTVPTARRWDVHRVEDLYEEIARSIGYNALPESLYIGTIETYSSVDEKIKDKVNQLLVAKGFYEHFTDAFYGPQTLEKMGIQSGHALYPHVHINNAIEKHYALLRNNCISSALQIAYDNFRFGTKDLKIFEWTRVFSPGTKANCVETQILWGLIVGQRAAMNWQDKSRKTDIFYLKGLVENIAIQLQCQFEFTTMPESMPIYSLMHPYQSMAILLEKEVVGVIGEIHPKITQAFDIKQAKPCYFEIYPEKLISHIFHPQEWVLPPALPPIERNLSFVIPKKMITQNIIDFIEQQKYDRLQSIVVMDLYAVPQSEMISVMFQLVFENTFGLTNEHLNQTCETIIREVEKRFQDENVHLRT